MLDIGFQELAVIMVLALLIFGPDKLPDLGRRLGRAMREFRRASDEFRSTVEQNLQINAADQDMSPRSPEPAPASSSAGPDGQADAGPVGEPVGVAAEAAAEGDAAAEPLEPYWSSRGGRLLHRRECAWRNRIPESERMPLKTALDGWEQGLKPCPACDPKEAEGAA